MRVIHETKAGLVVVAILALCCISAKAAITLDLDNPTTYAKTGIKATLDVNASFIVGNVFIGIYGFSHGGSPTLTDNGPSGLFWSVCLDPLGRIDWNQHNYEMLTFAQANPGINPNKWASSGSDFWGVQNASYIWRNNYIGVLNSAGDATDKTERGAALALAMYEALYDSTGYGNNLGGNHFTVTSAMSATMAGYYTDYLASLLGFSTSSDIYNGYVLRGDPVTDGQNGQEFILIGTPVPEPSTILAGAMLFLPFGASTVGFLRKNRKANG